MRYTELLKVKFQDLWVTLPIVCTQKTEQMVCVTRQETGNKTQRLCNEVQMIN